MERMKNQKKTLIGSIVGLLLAVGTGAFAQATAASDFNAEIKTLQAALKHHAQVTGAPTWVAGETSLSRLSLDELKKRVGASVLNINLPEVPVDMGILSELPSSLDWRDHSGNFVSPIKDQKSCGSCWAFAMTGGLESNALLTHADAAYADLSEQVLISCGKVGSCNGGTLNAEFLKTTGLPPEHYYGYTATDGDCSTAGKDWQSQAYKIGSWGKVKHSLPAIKAALAKYGPLPTTFFVFKDFMHYKSGVYTHILGLSDIFNFLGGHAVLLVGYNDEGQYFIVKNSWGTGWGEAGYFRVAYSDLWTDSLFGMSTIAYQTADSGPVQGLRGTDDSAGKDPASLIAPILREQLP
jgi:C1A family cysteine protease